MPVQPPQSRSRVLSPLPPWKLEPADPAAGEMRAGQGPWASDPAWRSQANVARLHSVYGTSLSPTLSVASSRGIGLLPKARVRFHAASWGASRVGVCRGLLDPCDLALVVSPPENQDGTGGRTGWAGLLGSFTLEIHSTDHHFIPPLLTQSRGYW